MVYLAASLFLFLRLPTLFEPYWYGDEGIYLTLGQAIKHGLTIYQQIHDNKPPTLYYLAALGGTVFGFRLLLLLWMIPTLYCFYLLVRHFFSGRARTVAFFLFLILSSIPLIEGTIANAEIFMLLPTIAAFLLFLQRAKKPSSSWFLWIGLLLGFAFTIKVPVAIEFAFICFWLLLTSLQNLKSLIPRYFFLLTGFSLPILLWTFYFYLHGALTPFLNAALLQNFGYLSSWATGSHTSSVASGGLSQRGLVLIGVWMLLAFLFLKKKVHRDVLFVVGWFTATIFGALLSGRPYPHYLIQVLPPFCLLVGFLFVHLKSKLLAILSLLGLLILTVGYQFYYYPVVRYYLNFYSYIFHLESPAAYQAYFGSRVNDNQNLANFLQASTTPQDQIFVWGDEPFVYAESRRLPVGRFTVAYHIVELNAQKETMDKLEAHLPNFIITYPMANRPFPALNDFIDKYYYFVRAFGDAQVYHHRS